MSETGGCQLAYGVAMDAFPDWQDISRDNDSRVSGWTIRRGRTDEFTRTGTGTATIYVNDLSHFLAGGEFPTHARIMLRGQPMFRGYVDEVNVEVDPSGVVERVAIECVDAFDLLSSIEISDQYQFPGFSDQRVWGSVPPAEVAETGSVFYEDGEVDTRLFLVLFDAKWPASLMSIFSGNINVMESVYDPGTSVLQMLFDAADAEFPTVANLFAANDGVIKFRGRFARFNPSAYGIPTWSAGTGSHVTGGTAQIRALGYTTGKKQIFNSALCYPDLNRHPQAIDMTEQIMIDQTSIDKWGLRSWSAENIITLRHNANGNTGAEECQLFAEYIIQNYSQPVPRVSRIQLRSLRDSDPRAAATWALMCGVEIGDLLELSTDWISGTYFVEGITASAQELDGTIPDATVELDLSPAAHWTVDPF